MSSLAALIAGALVVGGSDAFVPSSSFTGTMLQQSARVDFQVIGCTGMVIDRARSRQSRCFVSASHPPHLLVIRR